ncbi:riboflavin synthase [Rudaeicoccus suwonensis]|uniref:Riboflavin synthase n=1 Tax=Rudaeicoccus suwonensis TaxID=657409 RepID=A0A561EAA8_9MICO|nr:riboflavin synthase [Rudaeicoccus suwonensis]TWE12543.1 riboflavin synthase alpha chain [Rudaeicoccus suwonensis]
MFTGIVEELGTVDLLQRQADSARLRIRAALVVQDAELGASIAVNGVCLTVTEFDHESFAVDVMAESLDRSGLGSLVQGDRVNLERAMSAGGRFGGHIVQGHVDGVATIAEREQQEHWTRVTAAVTPELAAYVVEKGSITLDGVSLTVAGVTEDTVTVCLIPTTLAATTLGIKGIGDNLNVEVDILAKYVERLVGTSTMTKESV